MAAVAEKCRPPDVRHPADDRATPAVGPPRRILDRTYPPLEPTTLRDETDDETHPGTHPARQVPLAESPPPGGPQQVRPRPAARPGGVRGETDAFGLTGK